VSIKNTQAFLFFSCCLVLSTVTFAYVPIYVSPVQEGPAMDSDQLGLKQIKPGKKTGFVLTTGTYTLFCLKGNLNCDYKVSTSRCPPGYTPNATTAIGEIRSSSTCIIKQIYLEPRPAVPLVYEDGYKFHFNSAYAEASSASCGYYQLKINYSIFCAYH